MCLRVTYTCSVRCCMDPLQPSDILKLHEAIKPQNKLMNSCIIILLRSKVYFPRELLHTKKDKYRSNTANTKAVIKHLPTIKKQQQSVKLQVLVNT